MAETLIQNLDVKRHPQLYGRVFRDVQEARILPNSEDPDSKYLPDSETEWGLKEITRAYNRERGKEGFDLYAFVITHFRLPPAYAPFQPDLTHPKSIDRYISDAWGLLTREPTGLVSGSTLISVPNRFIVPGGRFREFYYWDTFFTALGLIQSRNIEMVVNMCDNFAYLIDNLGFIPNGNRVYYTDRSQPPYFALMVHLLDQQGHDGTKYLPQLEKEYAFWMRGKDQLRRRWEATERVVQAGQGVILNRYFSNSDGPREESYFEDNELARNISRGRSLLFRNIRAGAEGGTDFAGSLFKDGLNMKTINTTNIIPVDLNCLLYFLETKLAELNQRVGNNEKAKMYSSVANDRGSAILDHFWSEDEGFFVDFDRGERKQTGRKTMAGVMPLFMGLATADQASSVAELLGRDFLKEGGFVTSLRETGQQWDYPNGWPPLQWLAIQALKRYDYNELANNARERWLTTCEAYFRLTQLMIEKYNVINPTQIAEGGEYKAQIGFGWTIGVYLDLKALLSCWRILSRIR